MLQQCITCFFYGNTGVATLSSTCPCLIRKKVVSFPSKSAPPLPLAYGHVFTVCVSENIEGDGGL